MSQYALANALTIGAIFSLMALGLYIAFRVIRFPDLTCDGSYALGACSTAAVIHAGYSVSWTPVVAIMVGFTAGALTGVMYSKLKFPHVVSGIIIMTAAYSVNLLIMGVPNLSISAESSFFGVVEHLFATEGNHSRSFLQTFSQPFVGLFFVGIIYLGVLHFLNSEIGLRWRCVGVDSRLAERNGINTEVFVPIALGVANALIALAGSMFAHFQRFADVNMGVGIIMAGLASVFLGQAFESIGLKTTYPGIFRQIICVLVGSIAYRLVVTYAYEMGLPTNLFSLTTSLLVFLALLSPGIRQTWVKTFTRA